ANGAVTPMTDAILHPHHSELVRRVAAGVARIGPVLAIKVEVVGSEQVHRQGLDTRRWFHTTVGLGCGYSSAQHGNGTQQQTCTLHHALPLITDQPALRASPHTFRAASWLRVL